MTIAATLLPRPLRNLVLALLCLLLLSAQPRAQERDPQTGAADLLGCTEDGLVPLPQLFTRIELTVSGLLVHGVVEQAFVNPGETPLEAVYVFPLPDRAAVHALEMHVGDRRIVAVVQEREEARRTYEKAREEGKKAGLLEHRKGNLFTTAVSGINPGERVTVRIEYVQEAGWNGHEFETVVPLTYTPRYHPGGAENVERRDVATVPEASLRARFEIAPERVESPTHSLEQRAQPGTLEVVVTAPRSLAGEPESGSVAAAAPGGPGDGERTPPDSALPSFAADRDVVLRWRPRLEPQPTVSVAVEDREDGRYALLMVLPPRPESVGDNALPADTVFVVDTSGSMDGPSIKQARAALKTALERLRPGDGFALLRFSDDWTAFRHRLSPAEPDSIARAIAWVDGLEASGGTEIVPALVAALDLAGRSAPGRLRRVVLLTDGAIENEDEALHDVLPRLEETSLHVIGIGTAPNAYLMSRLAGFGRGACEFIRTPEEVSERTRAFLERLERPVLTDLELQWRGAPPLDAQPERLPDLFAGDPLFISVRLGLGHPGLTGELVGRSRAGPVRIPIELPEGTADSSGVAVRWARAKVETLLEHGIGSGSATVRAEVVSLACEFALVTPWTSLVAVDDRPSVNGVPERRGIANALPAGFRPCGGQLPAGGTDGPLLTRVGFALLATGVVLILLLRRGTR